MNIRPIQPSDNIGAQQLILKVVNEEFGMGLTLDELPDLKDIVATYMTSGEGHYWVAVEQDEIIGSIGVMKLAPEAYELRRMYVAAKHRGRGVAQKLMDVLFFWAATNLSGSLFLETNEQWKAAQHIYDKYGFTPVGRDDLPPSFPVVRVATGFYRKDIKEPNQAMQTTPRSVTCCAYAQHAPARSVSDLGRSATK